MTENKCPECGSAIINLSKRNYPMITEERGRFITRTYRCEMCACEFTEDGTPVEVDRKQTLSSSGSIGYHKMY